MSCLKIFSSVKALFSWYTVHIVDAVGVLDIWAFYTVYLSTEQVEEILDDVDTSGLMA
jgi:hypothetical protein